MSVLLSRQLHQTTLSYLQYDSFLPGNFDGLPRRVSEDGPRKRADIGDCAAKRIGLILANDPEGLPPAVSPAKSDGHAERGATFGGRRRYHFRTCAPPTPVTDFPLRGRGSLCVALIDCGPVGRLEAAESHFDRREAFFRHQVAMRGYGTIGQIVGLVFGVLNESATHGGYRCRTGCRFALSASMRLEASASVRSG